MARKLLTTGQVARLCSVTPDAVLKWIRAGRLPARRTMGGHFRVDPLDLTSFLPPPATLAPPSAPPSGPAGSAGAASPPTPTDVSPAPPKPRVTYCWEFRQACGRGGQCDDCPVYRMRAQRCFEAMRLLREVGAATPDCSSPCESCTYYRLGAQLALSVLVVTGDPLLRSSLASADFSDAWRVTAATCDDLSCELLDSAPPDVAVLDCQLSEDRLRQLCQHLAPRQGRGATWLILAEDPASPPVIAECRIYARITRPFTANDLRSLLAGLAPTPQRDGING